MTEPYRQKLLNWFCSISLVCLIAVLCTTSYWFYPMSDFRNMISPTELDFADNVAGPLGGSLIVYPIFFAPITIWHLFDFAQRDTQPPLSKRFFSRYRTLVITLLISGLAAILLISEEFYVAACSGNFSNCYRQSFGLQILFFGTLLFLLILCMSKAVASIQSRFKKA